jgi:hypothetical protein
MTYYEELGLGPDATVEQIRQAYRNLVRLLHPDQQADETLRRLAENQMKRLNSVHKTLTDPSLRRQYDASLSPEVAVPIVLPPSVEKRKYFAIRDVALLVIGVLAASLYWQMSAPSIHRSSALPVSSTVSQPLAGSTPPAREAVAGRSTRTAAQTRLELEATRTERDSALAEAVEPPPAIEAAPPAALPVIRAPVLAAPFAAATPAVVQFGGTWVYVRPRVTASQKALYPAEYVEAVVVEEAGRLRGRYRARYQVADRPISSEVIFRFEGKADRETASLDWAGAGGARGELKLKLLSRNSMQLEWIATELGSQMGLASGTAILTRRQEP